MRRQLTKESDAYLGQSQCIDRVLRLAQCDTNARCPFVLCFGVSHLAGIFQRSCCQNLTTSFLTRPSSTL
jgi:hypothetical protein